MELNKIYQFQELEKLLSDESYTVAFRVKEMRYDLYALMLGFSGNFSDAYQSGDGVLFYEDGETHSADPTDEFTLLEIITIKP